MLIRWFSATIRVVAYYSNFVFISAFFGLGVGALLNRFRFRLWRPLLLIVAVCVIAGPLIGGYWLANPGDSSEYAWISTPSGLVNALEGVPFSESMGQFPYASTSRWLRG